MGERASCRVSKRVMRNHPILCKKYILHQLRLHPPPAIILAAHDDALFSSLVQVYYSTTSNKTARKQSERTPSS